jgi:hypothetical protein
MAKHFGLNSDPCFKPCFTLGKQKGDLLNAITHWYWVAIVEGSAGLPRERS